METDDPKIWDAPFEICQETVDGLKGVSDLRQSRTYTWKRHATFDPDRTVQVVTDATKTSISWVILGNQGEVLETSARVVPEANVAYQELLAIVTVASTMRGLGKVLLHVLTDSAVADAVIRKRYSKSQELDRLIERIWMRSRTKE
jgi:hypothetical protein